MNSDIEQERPTIPRKKRGCFSCALACLIVGLAAIVWGLWTAAATGFVRIPVISALAFEEPTPTRMVEPTDVTPGEWLEETLVSEFNQRLLAGAVNNRVTITTPEEVLTGLVRASAETVSEDEVPVDLLAAQIVTRDDGLEIFVPFKEHGTSVLLLVLPSVSEEGFMLEVKQLEIGSWRVPRVIVRQLVNRALRLGVDEIEQSLGRVMTLEDIRVFEAGLEVTGTLIPGALTR